MAPYKLHGILSVLALLLAHSGLCDAEVLTISSATDALSLTGGYCVKNISVKYQVPVTRTRNVRHIVSVGEEQQQRGNAAHGSNNNDSTTNAPTPITTAAPLHNGDRGCDSDNDNSNNNNNNNKNNQHADNTEQYIEFEERIRWETVNVCCPGYRSLLFGFCTPICTQSCPKYSYCTAPEKCQCLHGYEQSHHPNKQHQLICRPVCVGGCPEHSQCVLRNRCECRPGYKAANSWWFQPLRCERIQCSAADQRYDVERRNCVKIEMSMEELMQRVAAKLARGFNATTSEDDDDADGDGYDDSEELSRENNAGNVRSGVPVVAGSASQTT